jgi:hypothetical protein
MVEMLQRRTQPTTIYKVKAHININGNEQSDTLAKTGTKKSYKFASKPHEFAHTTPYYFHKDIWPGPTKRPDKGLVRCLETNIQKHDREKKSRNNGTKIPEHFQMDNEPGYRQRTIQQILV